MSNRLSDVGIAAWMGNLFVLATLVGATLLAQADFEFYYQFQEEDGWVEWGTFWAFILGAGCFAQAALEQRRAGVKVPWYFGGIALLCFIIAMEEISWGQRLLGYRAPEYFLEHNFQQELNVHNLASSTLRYLVLEMLSLGYGVLFPLAALHPRLRGLLERVAIVAPPLALAPAFLATFALHWIRPWDGTSEWVELVLGISFLYAGAHHATATGSSASRAFGLPLAATVALVGLSGISTLVSTAGLGSHPAATAAAETELEALRRDFLVANLPTRCGVLKRLFNYAKETGARHLRKGSFASLVDKGLAEERARYLIDPWDSAYWVTDMCSADRSQRLVLIFSTGPNRRIDSTGWKIGGDDLGVVLLEIGLEAD